MWVLGEKSKGKKKASDMTKRVYRVSDIFELPNRDLPNE